MLLLPLETIFLLTKTAVSTGVALQRTALLSNLPPAYAAMLNFANNPQAQVLQDLNQMNQTRFLADGTCPLLIWLINADLLSGGQTTLFADQHRALSQLIAERGIALHANQLPEAKEIVISSGAGFTDVTFFDRAARVSMSVARVTLHQIVNGVVTLDETGAPAPARGTAWLCGAGGLMMSNAHVLRVRDNNIDVVSVNDQEAQRKSAFVEFDVETGKNPVQHRISRILVLDTALDFALFEIDRPDTLLGRTPLSLREAPVSLGAAGAKAYVPVNIIQHPKGELKRVAFRDNLVTDVADSALRYFTNTEHGSSGSPVCDDAWQVVALHRASSKLATVTNFQGHDQAVANVGTPIRAILNHLRADAALWSTLKDRLVLVGNG